MKMEMLLEVQQQVSKVHMQEVLMDAGLLRCIKQWLTPLSGGALPNSNLRQALYDLLGKLQIDEGRLLKSDGLGRQLMDFWRSKNETKANKQKLQQLIEVTVAFSGTYSA